MRISHRDSQNPKIIEKTTVIREMPVEKIIERVIEKEVDISKIQQELTIQASHISKHEERLKAIYERYIHHERFTHNELELQRRALVAIKMQRDIDRKRRLMLINRLKKERKTSKKTEKQLKIIAAISLAVSLISLIVKL